MGQDVDQILSCDRALLRYHMAAWLHAGSPAEFERYDLREPMDFEFRLSPEAERALRATLEVWTTKIQGLTKAVTRIQPNWQYRDCHLMERARTATSAAD